MKFTVKHKDTSSRARLGKLETTHGVFNTPVFMPVATQGTVKAVSSEDLISSGVQMIISNTYHLYMRPGEDIIEKTGPATFSRQN